MQTISKLTLNNIMDKSTAKQMIFRSRTYTRTKAINIIQIICLVKIFQIKVLILKIITKFKKTTAEIKPIETN